MIEVTLTEDLELVKSLMTIGGLPEASFADKDLENVKNGTWFPRQDQAYLFASDGAKALGVIAFEQISPVIVEWHWYINPAYWGKKYSDDILPHVFQFLKHTSYESLLAEVPEVCTPVKDAALRAGLNLLCLMPDAVIWRKKLVGLYLLHKSLKELRI